MASIAAVAQVEMKSRTEENQIGIQINTAGSKITKQEPCQAPVGTSISTKPHEYGKIKFYLYSISYKINKLKNHLHLS